ncbi:MAG: hypothetical protein M3552_12215, partial [Planctomycetota bacterium]|nr:hypothetical protein [Planctomycetota bacterium]
MNRPELLILVPCHGLEDFPADLGESEATGLLNAFAAAYHPALIAVTREIPGWRRADDPPGDPAGKIIIVPSACSSWLPHAWAQNATDSGAAVVEGIDDRDRLVEKLLAALHTLPSREKSRGCEPSGPGLERDQDLGRDQHVTPSQHDPEADAPGSTIDPELIADFLAFGTAYLQLDLLTRRMHYYSNLDSSPLRLDLLGAADAAVAGDGDEARRKLKRAFELLLDARERFFPVDSYLIDMCLLIPRLAEKLPATLSATEPTTLLATAADWEQIANEQPELVERLKTDVEGNRVGIAGGEYREGPTAFAPIESVLWEFGRGLAVYRKLFGRTPKVWARRRYGFSTLIPQILERSGMPFAVHTALDDGYYPDDEQSKFRWEGCDGVGVDAFSRIPLAADGATSFLRFSQRVAEAMEGDQSAAIMFARWPELSTPWFEDLRRIHRYAPVFGKFVTLEGFFQETSPPSRTQKHSAKEYFAPYLTQAVAREQSDPIARFGGALARRHLFDATMWMRSLAGMLRGRFEPGPLVADEDFAERAPADADADLISVTDRDVAESSAAAAKALAEAIPAGAPAARGAMIINPLSFPRRVTVELPEGFSPPKIDGPVKHVLFKGQRRAVTLDLPAAGFHWLPASSPPSAAKSEPPTAEGTMLR